MTSEEPRDTLSTDSPPTSGLSALNGSAPHSTGPTPIAEAPGAAAPAPTNKPSGAAAPTNEPSGAAAPAPTHDFPPRDEAEQRTMPSLRLRIVQILFIAALFITTIFLAKWQWGRYNSSSGSLQNLGYALQWPIIGGFFVVAYRKYLQYEKELVNGDEAPAVTAQAKAATKAARKAAKRKGSADAASAESVSVTRAGLREIPDDFFPERSRPTARPNAQREHTAQTSTTQSTNTDHNSSEEAR